MVVHSESRNSCLCIHLPGHDPDIKSDPAGGTWGQLMTVAYFQSFTPSTFQPYTTLPQPNIVRSRHPQRPIMGSTRVSKTARLGFLDLPPELRLKVYRYLFVLEIAYLQTPWTYEDSDDGLKESESSSGAVAELEKSVPTSYNKSAASPQLLQTCKLCLSEGLPVLYGENRLTFNSPTALRHFIDVWGNSVEASIKCIVIESSYGNFRGFSPIAPHLKAMTNLQKFDFSWVHWVEREDLKMTLKKDVFLGRGSCIKANLPCHTFLKKLFGKRPHVEVGSIFEMIHYSQVVLSTTLFSKVNHSHCLSVVPQRNRKEGKCPVQNYNGRQRAGQTYLYAKLRRIVAC